MKRGALSWLLSCAVWASVAACASDDARLETDESSAEADCACRLETQVDNLALCVSPTTAFAPAHVFSSSWSASDGRAVCEPWRDPQPVPSAPWSKLRVSSRCTGEGALCITVRAGRVASPSANDCVLVERCVPFTYATANGVLELPPLAAWVAESSACALRNEQVGSYYEFRLRSEQLGCGSEAERVTRVAVCPARCRSEPRGEGCEVCGSEQVMTWF